MKEKVKCPICGYKDTSELIVDLLVCNWCNHIFKKDKVENDSQDPVLLEYSEDPISDVRQLMEEYQDVNVFDFDLPSMVFETFELHPKKFYNHEIKHYFNQMSLMVFVKRCNLIPIEQTNYLKDGKCRTRIKCRRITPQEYDDVENIHTVFFED